MVRKKKITAIQKRRMAEYGELFDFVAALLSLYDPMSLNFNHSTTEYQQETAKILPHLRKCQCEHDVCRLVHKEFARAFGAEGAGTREEYMPLSIKLWELWVKSKVPVLKIV